MTDVEGSVVTLGETDIKVTRLIHAPQALVWQAFTDVRHIHNWWGPYGFTTTTSEMHVAPGSHWRYVMHGPDGVDYVNWIRYTKVEQPALLEYDHGGDDPDHAVFRARITLAPQSANDTLVMLHLFCQSKAQQQEFVKFGATKGGQENLTRLSAFMAHAKAHQSGATTLTLTSPTEFVVTRDFKAPREHVFDAWTKAEQLRQWYGLRGVMDTAACDVDLRVGGQWRIVERMKDSQTDHVFSGEYRVIDRPARLVFTERYEAIAGSDHVVTMTLQQQGDVTTMSLHSLYPNQAMRDGHIASGMEAGMRITLDQLDALLTR